jgi:hypothetical protein
MVESVADFQSFEMSYNSEAGSFFCRDDTYFFSPTEINLMR